jgi:DNA repair exonuclease SbcCD nuclease subunit
MQTGMETMKPSAILTADLHLHDKAPSCRKDDFMQTQANKIKFLRFLQDKYNIPVLIAGDIFHKSKPTPELLRMAIELMPEIIAIPGQHDLPNHSIDLYDKSGLSVLEAAGVATVLINRNGAFYDGKDFTITGFPFGVEPEPLKEKTIKRSIVMIHELVVYSQQPWPGAEAEKARGILKKLKNYDLILSGDNHQQFTLEHQNRLLVNPGPIFRTNALMTEYQPKVYLWFAENNSIEEVLIPIEKDVIIYEALEKQKEKDARIEAYIEKIQEDYTVDLNFKDKLETEDWKLVVKLKKIVNII